VAALVKDGYHCGGLTLQEVHSKRKAPHKGAAYPWQDLGKLQRIASNSGHGLIHLQQELKT
jgi:hypothetical protein